MRCGKCGKNFDEDMYSGICPKCGHFNNRQTEYDVNKYISARFDEGDKISTSAQAAKQHEQLHRMYDSQNMHRAGAGSHEKLHEMYDAYNMHRQAQGPLSGNMPVQNYQPGVGMGRANPYQAKQPGMQGNLNQTGQAAYGQGGAYQTGTYGQGSPYRSAGGQTKAYREKTKGVVMPICIAIAVLAIIGTVIGCRLKRQSLEETYHTLEFEQETVQPGELFELNGRLFVVGEAKVVDTSALDGMPTGEKLVAVSMEILPAEKGGSAGTSGAVYVWDGSSYKLALSDYVVEDVFYGGDCPEEKEILDRYSFYSYIPSDGRKGECYFFVGEDAEEISISFEEGDERDELYVLERRVSVPLQLEEDGI